MIEEGSFCSRKLLCVQHAIKVFLLLPPFQRSGVAAVLLEADALPCTTLHSLGDCSARLLFFGYLAAVHCKTALFWLGAWHSVAQLA